MDIIHIGTSGWHYEHWRGLYYPENLSPDYFLDYYIKYFNTVEINSTFYHLPEEKTLAVWRDTVPQDFIFAAKASRYITHMKKLKDSQEAVQLFLKRVEVLEDKLGPILFQLPPHWHFNQERLQSFLRSLPRDFSYAFEFRDESWINEETIRILIDYNVAFCVYDFAGTRTPGISTADFVYLRLHGPQGAYTGQYDMETLKNWARDIRAWEKQGKQIYCYFDNDESAYAIFDAIRLKEIILEMSK